MYDMTLFLLSIFGVFEHLFSINHFGRHPTIDNEMCAGDETRLGTRQEQTCIGNVLGQSHPSHCEHIPPKEKSQSYKKDEGHTRKQRSCVETRVLLMVDGLEDGRWLCLKNRLFLPPRNVNPSRTDTIDSNFMSTQRNGERMSQR
jgi:hypothetical protein